MDITIYLVKIASEDGIFDLKAYQDGIKSIVIFIVDSEVVVSIEMIFDD